MTAGIVLAASPDPDPRGWDSIIADLAAAAHPLWCHNRDEIDGCRDVDEEYQVLHTRDAVLIPALSSDEKQIDVSVGLFRAARNGSPEEMGAELVIPGGHADLTRRQLRLLIAELKHLDDLWDL